MGRTTRWLTVLVVPATLLALAGCIESDTPPTFQEVPGTVTISSVVAAADVSPQILTEYGVFYSTNRDDIVAVNGVAYTNNIISGEDFVVRSGVQRVSVPANMQIAARQSGTLSVPIPNLLPNTTYYFRIYTVGSDQDGTPWKFALQVGQYTTVSSDAVPVVLPTTPGTLYTPVAPSTVYYSRNFTMYGYLKPRHTAGTYNVKLYGDRYERQSNGTYKWVRRVSVLAKNTNYSSYTKYVRALNLKLRGKWRFRAAHTHAGYATRYSGYRYLTVR